MKQNSLAVSCPFPIHDYPEVVMAHGGGGRLTHELIQKMFLSTFNSSQLNAELDGAVLAASNGSIVVSTDSHVISPLFFPGGDIGTLSIYGTVNDVAMCGAIPQYITVSFILEEGFSMESLWTIVKSIHAAAVETGVTIVTGDTKVVDKGKGDGLYINTTGIGFKETDIPIEPASIRDNDVVILSGDIGRHGIAVMASREGIEFDTKLESDCAPLSQIISDLLENKIEIHCMRDLTRGGLATAILEIAEKANTEIVLNEASIPISRRP